MPFSKILITALFGLSASISNAEQIVTKHTPYGVCGNPDQVIEHDSFITAYSYETKNPDWSAYRLVGSDVKVGRKRVDSFRPDDTIPEQYRAELKDYRRSGYDRGHLAPNAALDHTAQSQKDTFLLSNMVPQVPGHNRNGWKDLEEMVRDLAETRGEIYVVSGVAYDSVHEYIGNNVEIPDALYKIIYVPIENIVTSFLIPNNKFSIKELHKYEVSLSEIEAVTGYDFFCDGSEK